MHKLSLLPALALTACVTINIYFPAAAAAQAADEIIKGIQGVEPAPPQTPEPQASLSEWQWASAQLIDAAIAALINSAHADSANLSIDSPEIRRLRSSMESRFPALKAFYDNGMIGLKADGYITVRDPNAVPLKDRNQVNKLVAAENADRKKLYQAIADANGQPEWAGQIEATFAARWLGNAAPGWWYQQANGTWKQR